MRRDRHDIHFMGPAMIQNEQSELTVLAHDSKKISGILGGNHAARQDVGAGFIPYPKLILTWSSRGRVHTIDRSIIRDLLHIAPAREHRLTAQIGKAIRERP